MAYELSDLATSLERIELALQGIVSQQRSHGSMLKAIVDAATKPLPESNPVAEALKDLAEATRENSRSIDAIGGNMAELPSRIGEAFRKELDR